MKKLLLIASTLFLSYSVINAQSSLAVTDVNNGMASVANNSIIQYTLAADGHETTEIDAENTSSTTKYYKLRRTDVALNPGASAYFCVGGANCYGPATTISPITVTLTAGQKLSDQNLSLLLDLEEVASPGVAGFSSIKYELYNINDANDVFTFKLNYNDDLTSVKNNSQLFSSISAVFPNPAINKAHISIASSEQVNDVMVTITNSLGSLVSTKYIDLSTGKNLVTLDSESLSSGIYFATISSNKIKIVKKFTVNK